MQQNAEDDPESFDCTRVTLADAVRTYPLIGKHASQVRVYSLDAAPSTGPVQDHTVHCHTVHLPLGVLC